MPHPLSVIACCFVVLATLPSAPRSQAESLGTTIELPQRQFSAPQQAAQSAISPDAESWLSKAPTSADLIIYADDAGDLLSEPGLANAMQTLLGLSDATETSDRWAAFAESLGLTPRAALEEILGDQSLFAVSTSDDNPLAEWVLVTELDRRVEKRILAALEARPRKQLRRATVYAFERGQYSLVFAARSQSSVRTIIAPASSEELLAESLTLAFDDDRRLMTVALPKDAPNAPIVCVAPASESSPGFTATLSPAGDREWSLRFRGASSYFAGLMDTGSSSAFACDPEFDKLPDSTLAAFVGAAPSVAQWLAVLATGSDLLGTPEADLTQIQNLGPTSTLVFNQTDSRGHISILGARKCAVAPHCVGDADQVFALVSESCENDDASERPNFNGVAPSARRRAAISRNDATLAQTIFGEAPTLVWEYVETPNQRPGPASGWIVMHGTGAAEDEPESTRSSFADFLSSLDAGCAHEKRLAAAVIRPASIARLAATSSYALLGEQSLQMLQLFDHVQWEIVGPVDDSGSLEAIITIRLSR